MTTLCNNCIAHRHIVRNPQAPNVWYNHFCAAYPREKGVDPVTGEDGYLSQNDLGNVFYDDMPFDFCRDHNDGNCPEFTSPVSRDDFERALNGR